MANLSYPQRRKIQIYLIAAMLAILCCILVACNSDNSYSVAGETVSEPTHFMAKFMIIINNALGGGVARFCVSSFHRSTYGRKLLPERTERLWSA